jgi:Phage QLRG family, putative DNA packaging.
MPNIVTLAEAKLFIRLDHDIEDEIVELMIATAEEAVLAQADGWSGDGEVPARLKMAVLTRVCIMFDERTSVEPGNGEDRLLAPLRSVDL